jgi:hypothetical protein
MRVIEHADCRRVVFDFATGKPPLISSNRFFAWSMHLNIVLGHFANHPLLQNRLSLTRGSHTPLPFGWCTGGGDLIAFGTEGRYRFLPVSAIVAISTVNHRRIRRARAWLESRALAEEVLIVGASLDAANELARRVVAEKGAAFGWHRLTLPQLAAALAAPLLAERGLVPLSRLGAIAVVARVVHRLKSERRLGRYQLIGDAPGFARAIAAVMDRKAQISEKGLLKCLQPIATMTRTSVRKPSISCSLSEDPQSGMR